MRCVTCYYAHIANCYINQVIGGRTTHLPDRPQVQNCSMPHLNDDKPVLGRDNPINVHGRVDQPLFVGCWALYWVSSKRVYI